MVQARLPNAAAIPSTSVLTIRYWPRPPFPPGKTASKAPLTPSTPRYVEINLYVTTEVGYFINVLSFSPKVLSPHLLSWPSMDSPLDLDDLVA